MTESIVRIELTTDLSIITQEIAKHIPDSFNEHGNPESDKYRWDFRSLKRPTVQPLSRGRINISASYYGDLETKEFLGGCHLGNSPGVYDPNESWVYIDLNVSAKPTVTGDGKIWYIHPTDIDVSVALGPNSDTKCSVFNVDVGQKLNELLGSASLKQTIVNVVDALKVNIPIADIWAKANTVTHVPLDVGSVNPPLALCIALNLSQIDIEQLTGTAQAVTIPLAFHIDPKITVTQESTCNGNKNSLLPKVVMK